MKKIINYIFLFFLFMIFQIGNVYASDLFTCTYNVDFNNFGYSVGQSKEVVITVTDSGANSNLGTRDSIGSYSFTWNGGFLNEFASQARKNNSCPSVLFGLSDNTIYGYVGNQSEAVSGMLSSFTVNGQIESKSSNVQTNTKQEVCSFNLTQANSSSDLKVSFYSTGSQKSWSITKTNNGNQEYTANSQAEPISIDGTIYKINTSDYDKYWNSDSCDSTPIYMQHGTNSGDYVIQSTKPVDTESGTKSNRSGTSTSSVNGEVLATNRTNDRLQMCDANENPKIVAAFKLVGILIAIIKVIAPIIIIILGMIDISRAVVEGKNDSIQKHAVDFLKRFIACILIYFAPTIISGIFDYIDGWDKVKSEYSVCKDCVLDVGKCPNINFVDNGSSSGNNS